MTGKEKEELKKLVKIRAEKIRDIEGKIKNFVNVFHKGRSFNGVLKYCNIKRSKWTSLCHSKELINYSLKNGFNKRFKGSHNSLYNRRSQLLEKRFESFYNNLVSVTRNNLKRDLELIKITHCDIKVESND